jgi:hypothetical protein
MIILGYCQRMARVAVAAFGTNHGLALATELAVAVLKVIRGYKVFVHSLSTHY